MRQSHDPPLEKSTAEYAFKEAFERLKAGVPTRLPIGTTVSQNNVAKEAGCDPSALRKSRYPSLISEIQYWLSSNMPRPVNSPRQKIIKTREYNRSLKERLVEMKAQRDHANSLLIEANAKILDLSEEIGMLRTKVEPTNVPPIRKSE